MNTSLLPASPDTAPLREVYRANALPSYDSPEDPVRGGRNMRIYTTHRFWLGKADTWIREVNYNLQSPKPVPGGTAYAVFADPGDGSPLMAESLLNLWLGRWGAPPMLLYGHYWPPTAQLHSIGQRDRQLDSQLTPSTYGSPYRWLDWRECVDMTLGVMRACGRVEIAPPGTLPPVVNDRLTLRTTECYPSWPLPGPAPREIVIQWRDDRAKESGRTRTRILHEDYRAWCEARGYDPQDETGFGTMLTDQGYPSYKTNGQMHRRLSLLPA